MWKMKQTGSLFPQRTELKMNGQQLQSSFFPFGNIYIPSVCCYEGELLSIYDYIDWNVLVIFNAIVIIVGHFELNIVVGKVEQRYQIKTNILRPLISFQRLLPRSPLWGRIREWCLANGGLFSCSLQKSLTGAFTDIVLAPGKDLPFLPDFWWTGPILFCC